MPPRKLNIPTELIERLEAYAARVNVEPSKVVADLLHDYLECIERRAMNNPKRVLS